MRRILFVEHIADIIGGGQISLLGLMGELCREQYEPLFAGPDGGSMGRAVREAGIPMAVADFPSLRGTGGWRAGIAVWRLWRQLRRERVDLVHANSSRGMFYAGLAGCLARVPVVWHVRIVDADGWWDQLLGCMAVRVVVISQAVRRRFSGVREGGKIRVIYNGEKIERYARVRGDAVRQELGQGAEILVGMVARLTEEKDHQTFLRAAALIAAQLPGTRFLIVGEDPDPAQIRQRELAQLARELGLEEQVVFAGQRQDVPEVMAALDLLLHCARQEGFGRVLVEAMASGRAIVATAVGGIPEVVVDGETGILVPPQDPEAIARAAVALLRNPERRTTMGLAGQRRVRECFSLEAHVAQMQELYEEVLAAE